MWTIREQVCLYPQHSAWDIGGANKDVLNDSMKQIKANCSSEEG